MKKLLLLLLVLLMAVACKKSENNTPAPQPELQVKTSTFPERAKDMTIYEVNIRQHTPEGTFKAFQEQLPKIKELGADILWIMPIQPIGEKNRKGSLVG
jgi:1,4-alpha-glucan branching enzyme